MPCVLLLTRLSQLEASAKQWRDAWTNILNHQLSAVENLLTIFKPLGGESSSSHTAVETPTATLERVAGLHDAFSELKTDMMEEVKDIDRKLVVPAKLARDALKPMEKAIKKREDAKVPATPCCRCADADAMSHRSITNATRAGAKPCRRKRLDQSVKTRRWPNMKLISSALHTHISSPTKIFETGCRGSTQQPSPSCPTSLRTKLCYRTI